MTAGFVIIGILKCRLAMRSPFCNAANWSGSGTGKLKERFSMAEPEVNLTRTYDAVIVGSGAAGGMAAHVLTTHGLQVLMLEAGKKLPIEQELRSMEWPY